MPDFHLRRKRRYVYISTKRTDLRVRRRTSRLAALPAHKRTASMPKADNGLQDVSMLAYVNSGRKALSHEYEFVI
jgi:hypothetical protein